MAEQHTRYLLKGLGYPGAETFDIKDKSRFQDLVHKLEDKWIRSLPVGGRSELKPSTDATKWIAAFQKYLGELDCPIKYQPSQNDQEVLDWLLRLATSYAYDEAGDAQETKAALNTLLEKLHISLPNASTTEQLLACKAMLEDQVGPAIQKSELGKSARANAQLFSTLDSYQATLGFTTGDKTVDSAATLMRMLFIRDLRSLQTDIDNALVDVQEYTMNPKSNAKLGVVGR